jgi:Tol biopolymer transport system component
VQVRVRVEGDSVTSSPPQPTPTRVPDPLITPTPLGQGIPGKVVFMDASGGNIYTVKGDGTNLQRVTFGLDPMWNHAGTQIAFARQGPIAGIYAINADGANERLLYQTQEPRAPIWSPDDSEIVFSYQAGTKGGGERCFGSRCFELPSSTEWRLGAVSLSDGSFHDVRSSGNAFTPTWSPDGTIAFNDTQIGLMTTTSRGEPSPQPFIGDLRVTSDSYNPLRIMSPQYSPDGKLIVYMVMQPPTWQIALAAADGSNQHLLTKDVTLAYYHPSNVAPEWSPDSKQVLFLSNRNNKWEFFVMNSDGTNPQQVLKNVTDAIEIRYDFQAGRMMSWTK